MSVKIETIGNGTNLHYPDGIEPNDLIYSLGCIYLHAKAHLEFLSSQKGVDLIKAVEERIHEKT